MLSENLEKNSVDPVIDFLEIKYANVYIMKQEVRHSIGYKVMGIHYDTKNVFV